MKKCFKLSDPQIDDTLTYTGTHMITVRNKSKNYEDYESFYHMDKDPNYAEYAAVSGKREASTISDDTELERAFYESKLLVSTVDDFVRVLKVVHVSDEEYFDGMPGVPLQKGHCVERDPQRDKCCKAWGAILNRQAVKYVETYAQRLLLMINNGFWNDVLGQISSPRVRQLFDKRTFFNCLLKHNPAWVDAIPDEGRRTRLLEKCFNLTLRWTRFKGLWSRIPQDVQKELLHVNFGLFTHEEHLPILAAMKIVTNSNPGLQQRCKEAATIIHVGEDLDDAIEEQPEVSLYEATSENARRKKRRTQAESSGQSVPAAAACESKGELVGPAPGSACYRRGAPGPAMQGWDCSHYQLRDWGFAGPGMHPGKPMPYLSDESWTSLTSRMRTCDLTGPTMPSAAVPAYVMQGAAGADVLAVGDDAAMEDCAPPEHLPAGAGFPRHESSAAGAGQVKRGRGRPPMVKPSSSLPQREQPPSQRLYEHHWGDTQYDLPGTSISKDLMLRDAIRKAQEEDPFCLPMAWRDEEGNREDVGVNVVTLALERLLLRKDLPAVNQAIEGIASNLAVQFERRVPLIAAELAKESISSEFDRFERECQLYKRQAEAEIERVKHEYKQKLDEGVMAAIKMRREHFARKFHKKKSGEPLPERRITSEEAQAELADKRLRNLIQVELELDLDVDRKISAEQRYLDELIAQRDAEKSKQERYEEEQTQLMNTIADVVKKGREEAETLRQEIATLKRERDVLERVKTQALEDVRKMHEKLDHLEKCKLLEKACDCQVGQILDELGVQKGQSISAFTRARVLEWLRQDVVPLNSAVLQHAAEGTVFDVAAMESVGEPSPPDTAPVDSDAPQPGRTLLEDTQVYNRRVLWHQQEVLEQALEYNADVLHMEHNFVVPCKQWQVIANDMTALKNDMLERLRTLKESLKEMDGYLCTEEDILSDAAKTCDDYNGLIRCFSSKHGDKLAEVTKEAAAVFDAIAHHVQKFNEKHSEILVQSGVNRAVEDARAKYTALQEVMRAEIDETKARRYADTHDERCECLMLFDRVESIMEDITQQIVRCKGQRDLPDATHLGLRCDQLADCLGSLRLVVKDLQR